ncbi:MULTISPECIES: DNA polymerase III subunit theta [unclassified Providencia]|uniref:DNA polymerase III subunit theta n=1 Tax=unclassified Providencia TaxID=2633465 RepID=UPI003FA74E17
MLICVKSSHPHVTISAQLVTVIHPPCYTPVIHSPQKTIMHNLAELSKEDKDKVNVDLSASGASYKERIGKPVIYVEFDR